MTTSITTKYRQAHGFTLLEVMVAVALLGLILVTLYSGLYSARLHWQAGQQKVTSTEELRILERVIRKYLSSSIPVIHIRKTRREVMFSGETDSLTFITRLPAHRGGGGLYQVTLATREENDNMQLVLFYHSLNKPDAFDKTVISENVTLVSNIEGVSFSYLAMPGKDKQPEWQKDWQEENELPAMVRIQLWKNDANTLPQLDIPLQTRFVVNYPEFVIREAG
ncbi:MAG: prepilin-type N-terminal cleavage/methylation domain-containing protein [Gammaproteobacteria bacterium]